TVTSGTDRFAATASSCDVFSIEYSMSRYVEITDGTRPMRLEDASMSESHVADHGSVTTSSRGAEGFGARVDGAGRRRAKAGAVSIASKTRPRRAAAARLMTHYSTTYRLGLSLEPGNRLRFLVHRQRVVVR